VLDGAKVDLDFGSSSGLTPTSTVLNFLRNLPEHRGVKEGCAEGDCGACTVVLGELTEGRKIRYRAVDSCLLFLPMLHGKQLVTVENLKSPAGDLHPVQRAMVDSHGSQCGFCTPGIVMSLFAFLRNSRNPSEEEARNALAGNLCRCTGYRPIIEAAIRASHESEQVSMATDGAHIAELLKSIPRKSISISVPGQRYDQPGTLKECLSLIKRFPKAVVVNGATDVALRVTKRYETLPHVIDLSRIEMLSKVTRNKSTYTIGSGVKINDLMNVVSDDFPAFGEMLRVFGADQIRNIATLGGNIGTASPVGDILPVLIAYGAKITLQSSRRTRTVRADEFVTGYRRTEHRPDELITSVVLPVPSKHSRVRTYKVSKRRDLDIATLSAGFRIDLDARGIIDDVVLAYGGMAERTKRAHLTEKSLKGMPWTRGSVERAQRFVGQDFQPITDVRGSAEFRTVAAKNLIMKFWNDTH